MIVVCIRVLGLFCGYLRCATEEHGSRNVNHSQVPMLCSTGCGFYVETRTNGIKVQCVIKNIFKDSNSSNGRISPPGK